jgi:hypothetical protein
LASSSGDRQYPGFSRGPEPATTVFDDYATVCLRNVLSHHFENRTQGVLSDQAEGAPRGELASGVVAETDLLFCHGKHRMAESGNGASKELKRSPVDFAHSRSTFIYKDGPGVFSPTPKNMGETSMRVMVIVKANKESEAGVLPDAEILTKMGKYNEQLAKAGVMLAADGLKASSEGKRVKFSGDKRNVIDGPFAETKELIAGFWVWQVRSMDEAVEWLKRAPFGGGTEVEIRPLFEAADFGNNLTPEAKARDQRVREQLAGKK